jgi:Holliday junction DNA helicase RuvA
MRAEPSPPLQPGASFSQQVMDVMVQQLGHRVADARRMIADALKRNSAISTPEELFEEVYRGEQTIARLRGVMTLLPEIISIS